MVPNTVMVLSKHFFFIFYELHSQRTFSTATTACYNYITPCWNFQDRFIKSFHPEKMSFHLICPSSTYSTYPNKPQDFKINLSQPLRFNSDWEVCLHSISYNHTWEALPPCEEITCILNNGTKMVYKVPSVTPSSPKNFEDILNNVVKNRRKREAEKVVRDETVEKVGRRVESELNEKAGTRIESELNEKAGAHKHEEPQQHPKKETEPIVENDLVLKTKQIEDEKKRLDQEKKTFEAEKVKFEAEKKKIEADKVKLNLEKSNIDKEKQKLAEKEKQVNEKSKFAEKASSEEKKKVEVEKQELQKMKEKLEKDTKSNQERLKQQTDKLEKEKNELLKKENELKQKQKDYEQRETELTKIPKLPEALPLTSTSKQVKPIVAEKIIRPLSTNLEAISEQNAKILLNELVSLGVKEAAIKPFQKDYALTNHLNQILSKLTDNDLNVKFFDLFKQTETTYNLIEFKWLETENRYSIIPLNPQVVRILLTDNLAYMLGYNVGFSVKPNENAKYKADLSCQKSHMLIYSEDLIQPVVVGSSLVPLLEIFSITSKPGESCERLFLRPSYRKIVTKEISDLHFKLLDLHGRPYAFSYGDTILDLHFQKISKF